MILPSTLDFRRSMFNAPSWKEESVTAPGRIVWLVFAATTCFSLAGCVTPWARPTVVRPSTKLSPTALGNPSAPTREPTTPETMDSAGPADLTVRGQSPEFGGGRQLTPGSDDHYRQGMAVSGATGGASFGDSIYDPQVRPAQYTAPGAGGYSDGVGPIGGPSYPSASPGFPQSPTYNPITPGYGSPSVAPYGGSAVPQTYPDVGPVPYGPGGSIGVAPLPGDTADLEVNLRETQTGRFMFGVGVNSDLGLTAQVIIDERNFDWKRVPHSFDDIVNGTAFRGGGQALRIEAIPGSEVQRYLVNFTEPYLFDTPITFNLSGFLYDRRYYDWNEQRLGGRVGLGYRITPDLSISTALRLENVDITDPITLGIPELDAALGNNELYSGRITLTHDTRDIPFAPTEGHFLELSFEQAFGSFDFPKAGIDYRRYFLISERADRSGRHTLGFSTRAGFAGAQTPIFENYFAGGYSTMRGFRFRHASPKVNDVIVGGEFSWLNSIEYMFPITADDMLKGVIFSDFGTVEEEIEINKDNFRVAVGAGLRVSVPAMGPAPIALDLAVPIARADTDRIQNFSFFVGFGR